MSFTYGELVAIYDGLDKLPKDTVISSNHDEFEPVVISQLKEKVKNIAEQSS